MNAVNKFSDDSLLSAYLDNELPAEQADALSERLAREPALMQRLEALRASDAATREIFRRVDDMPMPRAVLDMLGQTAAEPADNVVALPLRGARRFLQMPVAIAASVALLAGFLANGFLNSVPDTSGPDFLSSGIVARNSELHELLENGNSTTSYTLVNGASATIVLTFEDKDGDFCRQARISSTSGATHSLACRRGDTWQVEALGFGRAAPDGQFQQASSDTPAALDAAIDGLIGAGDPLDSEDETRLISTSWEKLKK